MAIQWIGSPNKDKGREGFRPEVIVIHIMEGTLKGTDAWFKSEESGVSAHYGIGKQGEIHQYVGESDTAWHAGRIVAPTWRLLKPDINPNWYTIGIEHEGREDTPWSDALYEASARLIDEICRRWSIPCDRDHIIGHREIRSDKTCPGSEVDLDKLIDMANGIQIDPATFNFVKKLGSVKTRVDLNIRKQAPTTTAEVVRTVKSGKRLEYQGWTSNGLTVNGNAHWYKRSDGNYFWAGATERPIPGL
ncbi:MAG: N-acetylmuramoyl-L-alanine amidase [Nitrospira sp.]|nr:MAG: N-acetylmuramoyl-L-alanine amidase [Nitrospira sp.]